MARRGAEFGVRIDAAVRVDMAAVKSRKDEVVKASTDSLTKWLGGTEGLTYIQGHAHFESPRTVRIGERLLEADQFFLNVGGRASIPDMPGIREVPYLDNSSAMGVDFLPEHLMIVGGSYIGLEFAQMFRRFGSRVTVVEMAPRVIAREDEEVSKAIQEILEREGIAFRLKAECIAFSQHRDGIALKVSCDVEPREIVGSHVLLAVGRVPNTSDLGLDKAGVTTDKRGYIQVDDELRTNVPHIWALGDANGRGAFTHTSFNDYEIVAANLLDGGKRKVTDRIPTYALFIDPPLGRAGMTEREVRETGRKALVATMPMKRVGRARERGETEGFMKVLVDAESKRFLGVALLGIEGDEVVQSLLDAMYANAPYTVIRRAMHIHPTVAELIPTLLEGLKPLV
jgi:pyruvate/2-oxoglutarate dehydrogenase complex dihydrolipoamide dehydrogenase (E3) component